MTSQKVVCDPASLSRLLNDELDERQRQDLEDHLNTCQVCQRQLTADAASDVWWNETQELLGQSDEALEPDDSLSFLNPTDNPRMLGRFGGYEIAGLIGQGGMGIVLKAFDESLNRYAAIKVLAPQLATRATARHRFAREAKAAAAVMHDNVISIHGVSEAAGLPYLVMPYVRGESLQRRIDRDGPMTPTEIVRIAHQIASGLSAAHAQGLVHRDIKPANILLPDGVQRVLTTDFGLARAVDDSNLTGTGSITGTPQFMSPEQARGEAIDPRSDLFSLGTVMYVMCTGRNPFRADNPFGVLRRIIEDQPRPIREITPDIPHWLQHLVEKLQSRDPDDRYQDAASLANLLEKCLAHLQNPAIALPSELVRDSLPASRSSKVWLPLLASVFLLTVWGSAQGWFGGSNPAPLRQEQDSGTTGTATTTDKQQVQEVEATLSPALTKSQEQEIADARKRLLALSNQIMALQQEGNFLEAKNAEKKMLDLLRSMDIDHLRINELRKQMIELRLGGDNQKAEQVSLKIRKLERGISDRYCHIERLADLKRESLQLVSLRQKYAQLVIDEKHDEAESLDYEIAAFIRGLEKSYYDNHAASVDPKRNSASNDQFPDNSHLSDSEPAEPIKNSAQGTSQDTHREVASSMIAALQLELANVSRDYGPGHPKVNELKRKVEYWEMLRSSISKEYSGKQQHLNSILSSLQMRLELASRRFGAVHPEVAHLKKQIEYWEQLKSETEKKPNN